MNNNVEDIKSRINIVDLVGEYVRLTKAGTTWKGLCPFHNEKSPSFMVNEEKQFWHCFGCAKGGDVFAFVMEIESLGFREALILLAEKTGVQLETYNKNEGERKSRTTEILELATQFYEKQLWQGTVGDKMLAYLKERGLNDESIKIFRLGYAPLGWDNIIKFLAGKGFELNEIEKTGLLVKKEGDAGYYDRFRDRIMFPIADSMGKIVGYSARVAPGGDESQAKYINTPESEVYHKGNALYGINLAKNEIKHENSVLLVEGNMDVVAAHQAGIRNTVAISGTALTEKQIEILKRYAERVDMLFDMDSAGQNAARKSADLCFQKGMNVRIVQLKDGKDAAEVVQKDPKLLVTAVESAKDAMEYFLENSVKKNSSSGADSKKAIAAETLNHIKNFSSEIEKSYWIKKLAQAIDVEEKAIIGVLKSIENNNLITKQPVINRQQNTEVSDKDSFEKRSAVIRDKIAGIMISDEFVWKDILKKFGNNEKIKSDNLLAYLFLKGPESGFSFENLILTTQHEQSRKTLQKLFLDAKYQFDSKQNIIEYTAIEKNELIAQYIEEFLKELQKDQLASIIKEIKKAEQEGDKSLLRKLMNEFTKLSQELK
jgi:DNA primase